MSYIQDFIEFQRQEEFASSIERHRIGADEGRGLDSIAVAICPHCDRATVLEEHEYTPQRSIEPSEEHDGVYFTCEWCGAEVEPENERTPRKPAQSEIAESEIERIRRRA